MSGERMGEADGAPGRAQQGPSGRHCIVGIGASAGGLDAIERFFDHAPLDSGLTFVVVQHLSPDFKSLMDELLARHTRLPIHRVRDGMEVERDAVYLIPPKKTMTLAGGRLRLADQDHKSGLNLPIDAFFRSLAKDAGDRAIGVVLSGTGGDGSRGIKEIHEAGGLVVVQDSATAGFDGMPRAAVATGVADLILPPEAMPGKILQYIQHPASIDIDRPGASEGKGGDDLGALFALLRRQFGVDFTLYKPGTVGRRLERRMNLCDLGSLGDYIRLLEREPEELNALFRDLLVEVTQFFRDREAFSLLRQRVVPRIFEQAQGEEGIRAWVPGCATGEEAYSLAMLLHEYRDAHKKSADIKVFATDVHRTSLDIASNGIYPEQSLADIPPAYLARYFLKKRDRYAVSQELRQMVLFAPHNLAKDPPFTKLDLISCRNVLIYLNPPVQAKVLSLFHFGLKVGGFMFLGPSESVNEADGDFEAIDTHWKIFRKRREMRLPGAARLASLQPIPDPSHGLRHRPDRALQAQEAIAPPAYEALLSRYVPPGLLINERHELIHVFGDARRFLRVPEGRATSDLLRMIDEGLRIAVSSALHKAAKSRRDVTYGGVRAAIDGRSELIRVSVAPLAQGRARDVLYLIALEPEPEESAPPEGPALPAEAFNAQGEAAERIRRLEQELVHTREHLQTTIEELETSNEELQSTNEELVASNEELQSTNEELHSVNEELYTVNAEHQKKIDELTQLTSDMDNLLLSTDIGTIFLDVDSRIRKFTPAAAQIFNLLPQDLGRPLAHISSNIGLDRGGLSELIERVLGSGEGVSREVEVPDGKSYLARILPYRTQSGVASGAVLTFVDITATKEAQRRLELNERRLSAALEAGAICTWDWDARGDRLRGDDRFGKFFRAEPGDACETFDALIRSVHPDDQPALRDALREAVAGPGDRFEAEFRIPGPDGEVRHATARGIIDRDDSGRAARIIGACIDVTGHKRISAALQESQQLLKAILDNSATTIHARDLSGRYLFLNRAIWTPAGEVKDELLGVTGAGLIPEDRLRAQAEQDRRVIESGEPIHVEESSILPDGLHTFLAVKFPLRDGDGRIRGVGGISTDITRLKRAESEAREALARRDSFLAMLSHELRNPLAAILSAAYVIPEGDDDDECREAIGIVRRQGEQAARLLDDLLDVSRIAQNKIQFRDEVVDLAAVVREAARAARFQIESAGLAFEAQVPGRPIHVRGDAARLQQVFANLLANAAKYTAPGGRIRISAAVDDGGRAEVIVSDTGVGIEPEMIDRVFDLFVQASPSLHRADGGLGVGLTLARAIVERHGGRVTARSDGAGLGSEFAVRLATCPPPPPAPADGPAPGAAGDGRAGRPARRIVLVEDNDDSRRMLEALLQLEGCEVWTARDGRSGVESILEHRPDLALVDIGLPALDGYEVARRVRAAGGPPVRLIALTGYGREEDRRKVREAGFDEHLVKPLKRPQLDRILRADGPPGDGDGWGRDGQGGGA